MWDNITVDRLDSFSDIDAGRSQNWKHFAGGVEFSPDGRRAFTCGDGAVKVWDAKEGTLLLTLRPAHSPMRLSRDGRRIVAAGPQGIIQVWTADIP